MNLISKKSWGKGKEKVFITESKYPECILYS